MHTEVIFLNINFDVKDIIIYYVVVIEVIYCLSLWLSIQYYQTFEYY